MILGIGNDICDIRRIEKTLERFGERFLRKVFTAEERRKAFSRAHPAATLAKRFAAKEAMTKALGTGFRYGVHFSDIGVVNAPTGRPTLQLTGGAAKRLAEHDARRLHRPHRPDADRRIPARSSHRHHLRRCDEGRPARVRGQPQRLLTIAVAPNVHLPVRAHENAGS